jgi:hypothetical protein
MSSPASLRLSRREILRALLVGGGAWALSACGGSSPYQPKGLPQETPTGDLPIVYSDSTDALWDLLIPAERDAQGVVTSPGAREVGVDSVLAGQNLIRVAIDQGLLPSLPDAVVALFDDFQTGARAFLNRELDLLSVVEKPLASFSSLDTSQRERVLTRAFDDDRLSAPLLAARAACWLAFLGAISSDRGLVELGFPPFEDFANHIAVSGYPRITDGRQDDYSYNAAPAATTGDDLSAIIDADGNLR